MRDDLPKEGYVVTFQGDEGFNGKFYRLLTTEDFEYVTGQTSGTPEFSTVTTNNNTGFKDIDVLEPSHVPLRCAYVEMGFKDGLNYAFKLKSGVIRYGPDHDLNAAVLNNLKSPFFSPVLSFWLVWDWFPSVQATNTTPFTVTPKVYFRGKKYDIEEVPLQERQRAIQSGKYTLITLGGIKPS